MAMLEVKNLGISFGGLRAVNGFNITIQEGADRCIQAGYRKYPARREGHHDAACD